MKKTFLLLLSLFLLAGCKDIKLTNGENALVTFKEGGISSDELYQELKETYGAEKLMNLIDMHLLEKLYKTDNDEKAYVNQTVKTTKNTAKKMNADFDLYLNYYYGMANEAAFRNYLSLTYKRNLWIEDYAKETVSDKQIKEYYENETYGDIEASQILITVDTKKDATDDEKKKAEQKAYDTAKEVISKLKKGEDFATLAKQYSKDQNSSSNGGSLGKVNTDSVSEEVFSALVNLKDGSYSTSPVKASDGYHILYRKSQDKKPELNDELTEKIRTTIGSEIAKESGFSIKALKALREKNEMKILDTDLNKDFETLVNRQTSQSTSSSN